MRSAPRTGWDLVAMHLNSANAGTLANLGQYYCSSASAWSQASRQSLRRERSINKLQNPNTQYEQIDIVMYLIQSWLQLQIAQIKSIESMPNKDKKALQDQRKMIVKQQIKCFDQLNYSLQKNRKFIAKSYRQMQKILSKKYKYCCSDLYEGLPYTIVDEIINKSITIQPYMVGDFNDAISDQSYYQRTYQTIMINSVQKANRHCFRPKVLLDNKIIFESGAGGEGGASDSNTFTCYRSTQFPLTIEATPNDLIMLTTNGKDPTLAHPSQVVYAKNIYSQTFKPSCTIHVTVFNPMFRMHSEVLSIVAVYDEENGQGQFAKRHVGMVRPDFDINIEYSKENSSNISYIGSN